MRRVAVIFYALCVIGAVTSNDKTAADAVVPESATVHAQTSGVDATISDLESDFNDLDALVQEEATDGKLRPFLGHYDDPEDRAAMRNAKAFTNTFGRNMITGKKVTKTDNGMADTSHWHYIGGTKYVKSPGYAWEDAHTGPHGHYYLGTGRRRIGAGFGRRRAPVQLTKKDKKGGNKLWDKLDPTTKSKVKEGFHKRTVVNKATNELVSKSKKPFEKGVKAYYKEFKGLQDGPTFYEDHNYKGPSLTSNASIPDLSVTHIHSKDISSMKVPAGWCATLYTEPHYKGEAKEFCGPLEKWSLLKEPLHLKHMGQAGAIKRYTTTWEDEVASIMLTKYKYEVVPPAKCPTNCGMPAKKHKGTIICKKFVRAFSLKTTRSSCKMVKLTRPLTPVLNCKHTKRCGKTITKSTNTTSAMVNAKVITKTTITTTSVVDAKVVTKKMANDLVSKFVKCGGKYGTPCCNHQEMMTCCNPFIQNKKIMTTSHTTNNKWSRWLEVDGGVMWIASNDKKCGGKADEYQKGEYNMVFENLHNASVTISMQGMAESEYENMKVYLDGKLVVKLEAEDTPGVCAVNTCAMCPVKLPPKVVFIPKGKHKLSIKASTEDQFYQNNVFFKVFVSEFKVAKPPAACLKCQCK